MGKALRSPQFAVLGLTFFACCAAHAGPIFHMVSYAMVCGIGPMAAVSISARIEAGEWSPGK